jgi:hypothetical protein
MLLSFTYERGFMTYKELLENLSRIPEDRLNDTACVYVFSDCEFYRITELAQAKETDILDANHYYLSI